VSDIVVYEWGLEKRERGEMGDMGASGGIFLTKVLFWLFLLKFFKFLCKIVVISFVVLGGHIVFVIVPSVYDLNM
jgi:hypothetical protein